MDDYTITAEEAAAILRISGKMLRQRLRDERPRGARQVPAQHGGSWFLQRSYVEQLAAQRGLPVPWQPGFPPAPQPRTPGRDHATSQRPTSPPAAIPHRVWSDWVPFHRALAVAPRFPGVYMLRVANEPHTGPVYIGMTGERKGNGLRGRLAIYASGQGAASGLGEHAFDRALVDPEWMRARLDEALAGRPMRAKKAARSAIDHAGLEVRWQTVATRSVALRLEVELIGEHRGRLWNR